MWLGSSKHNQAKTDQCDNHQHPPNPHSRGASHESVVFLITSTMLLGTSFRLLPYARLSETRRLESNGDRAGSPQGFRVFLFGLTVLCCAGKGWELECEAN